MEFATFNDRTVVSGRTVRDYQPIRCVLEVDADSRLAVIVRPGCSVGDVYDMLQLLADAGGHFEHLTLVDEDETFT